MKINLFKVLLFIFLIANDLEYYAKMKYLENKSVNQLKIFIMAHKDFKNLRNNKVYNIVFDDKSQSKKKYNLNVIYANNGKLYNLSRAYGEMSKLYFIYQLYQNGTISSKYIGLNHYRRYFKFADRIPNLDNIFEKYDVILNKPLELPNTIREHYCQSHICKNFDEILEIIKDIKPKYYNTSIKVANEKYFYPCNLFIMKKDDFIEYCKFVFDILFEFDKRNNLTSDIDVSVYVNKYANNSNDDFDQSRLQGFLAERIGTFFFKQFFKNIKHISVI